MIHHPAYFDPADKVMLTYSMMKLNEGVYLISPGDIGFVEQAANFAAIHLPALVNQTVGWDGTVWFQRLESQSEGDLPRRLLAALAANLPDMPDPEPLDVAVFTCVLDWAQANHLPLSYWGKLWTNKLSSPL